ncbi:hypothetical protein A33M_2809 [Rhodovulum sp. PH10]|uniref:hypothetical protein n=1 Tax=Rhodovulum sp. PH10 TaxID=1187851 RepID=UPI00027C2902|nr:hypothetical protein [Rhodovulum sp. PH10]EJW11741.1 hypothetical protein A33M_2809 [Rhodovulum sp. PH10]
MRDDGYDQTITAPRGTTGDDGFSGHPAPAYAAVSFDLFDTLLMRRTTTPDGVFERACHHAGADVARPGLVESFVQHRRAAEARARKRGRGGRTREVGIEDIYALFPKNLFGLSDRTVEDLVEAEFRAELDLCVIDPEVAWLYQEARESGARTGFVSDTYWSAARLALLLRHCRPGLAWDFLYASCEHGTGKSDRLFERVLAGEKIAPGALIHYGDHPVADGAAPQKLGIATRPWAQAAPGFAGVLQREAALFSQLVPAGATGSRLDQGFRTARRRAARSLFDRRPGYALGATVLGPVMAAFDRFVADRVETLEAKGGRVAVAFLARDGMLSHRLWRRLHPKRPAAYVEINRRTALLAGADGPKGFAPLLDPIDVIDHPATVAMLGLDAPVLRKFFGRKPGGRTDGAELAAALPRMLGRKVLAGLAETMRAGLLAHLRRSIPDYDACTDLVLVDLGYSASVQKGLRRALDLAGAGAGAGDRGPRLHGLYLLTRDAATDDLGPDTAEGFSSDLVIPPLAKEALLRNVAVLEQLCCAPTGSVRAYRHGEVLREPDLRDPAQLALAQAAQDGAVHFADTIGDFDGPGFDPFADLSVAAQWSAAILARLLLLPTDDELVLLGSTRHDVNLGTRNRVALADPDHAKPLAIARALPELVAMPVPPMWPAASLAGLSPLAGWLYAQSAAGNLPGDVLGDLPCGTITVTLLAGETTVPVEVTCLRTPTGDIRLRVPLPAARRIEGLALPIGRLAERALLRGVTIQEGETIAAAMASTAVRTLPPEAVHGLGIDLVDRLVRSTPDGKLLVVLPKTPGAPIAVATILLTPLDQRPLALSEG